MPAQPTWFLHVPSILEQLRALSTPLLDRTAVEKLFGVRRRRAHALMGRFGGFQTGRTFLVDRLELIAALEALQRGDDFDREQRRKQRLSAELETLHRQLPGRRVSIDVAPEVRDHVIADLPSGIHLRPGELRVEFSGTEDLLRKLYELSQGILNDWGRFEALLNHPQA